MKKFRLEDCDYLELINGLKCLILTDVYNLFIMDALNYYNEIILLNRKVAISNNNLEIKKFSINNEVFNDTFYYLCKIDFKTDNRFLELDFNKLNYSEIIKIIQNHRNINKIQVKKNINNFKAQLKLLNIEKELILIDLKRIL